MSKTILRLFGAFMLAMLSSAAYAACGSSGFIGFPKDQNLKVENPLLSGVVETYTVPMVVNLRAFARKIHKAFSGDCGQDGTNPRKYWGNADEFADAFVKVHGQTMTFDAFVIKMQAHKGFEMPGFPQAERILRARAAAATSVIVATPPPASTCTFCKDVREGDKM